MQTIAIDIDDVLSNLAQELINFSNKKWDTNLTIDDYDEHWGVMWGVDDAVVKKRSDELHRGNLTSKLRHKPDAIPVLKKLSKNYNLVLATSRRRLITQETKDWINKYFSGLFTDIHFSGIFDSDDHADIQVQLTKAEVLKEVGASFLIDDQPKHCLAAAEAGITALLFGDYKWNRDVKLAKNMVRVKNWQEVLDYFTRTNFQSLNMRKEI